MLPKFLGTAFSSARTTGARSYVSGMSRVDVGREGSVSVSAIMAGAGASMSSLCSQLVVAINVVITRKNPCGCRPMIFEDSKLRLGAPIINSGREGVRYLCSTSHPPEHYHDRLVSYCRLHSRRAVRHRRVQSTRLTS